MKPLKSYLIKVALLAAYSAALIKGYPIYKDDIERNLKSLKEYVYELPKKIEKKELLPKFKDVNLKNNYFAYPTPKEDDNIFYEDDDLDMALATDNKQNLWVYTSGNKFDIVSLDKCELFIKKDSELEKIANDKCINYKDMYIVGDKNHLIILTNSRDIYSLGSNNEFYVLSDKKINFLNIGNNNKVHVKEQDANLEKLTATRKDNIRKVNITAVVDEEFRERYGDKWKERIDEYFREVAEDYRTNFGIKLVVSQAMAWNSSNEIDNCDDMIREIIKFKTGDDLITLILGQSVSGCDGRSQVFGKYSMVKDDLNIICTSSMIKHELGHNFGLDHIDDSTPSIMNKTLDCNAEWDDESRHKMVENKWRKFE